MKHISLLFIVCVMFFTGCSWQKQEEFGSNYKFGVKKLIPEPPNITESNAFKEALNKGNITQYDINIDDICYNAGKHENYGTISRERTGHSVSFMQDEVPAFAKDLDPKNFYIFFMDLGTKGGTTKEVFVLYNVANGKTIGPIEKDGLTWPARFMDDALGKFFVAGGLAGLGALIDIDSGDSFATATGGSPTASATSSSGP